MRIRKRIIVKPKLQLKYLLTTLIIVILTSLAIYFVLIDILYTSPFLVELSTTEIRGIKAAYTKGFIRIVFILLLVVGLQNLFFFHRVAGPIYVFEKVIKMISDGVILSDFKIRRSDELKELANLIQEMCNRIKEYIVEDRLKIEEITSTLDELINMEFPPSEIKSRLTKAKEILSTLTQRFKI